MWWISFLDEVAASFAGGKSSKIEKKNHARQDLAAFFTISTRGFLPLDRDYWCSFVVRGSEDRFQSDYSNYVYSFRF